MSKPTVFIPEGVPLGKRADGTEITVADAIRNTELFDQIVTFIEVGVRLLLETGVIARALAEKEKPNE